ncbi:hypothetical protein MG293_004688 [Ovis ammon polii]|uniref:60S ribosomal protein L37a n=1 Tax=Ovis ammon polii TaxID=230172 RepID=A0AAD4YEI9_OVIAM|nr:hypothetical protein MG293_004688 [Ovis ammon polii]
MLGEAGGCGHVNDADMEKDRVSCAPGSLLAAGPVGTEPLKRNANNPTGRGFLREENGFLIIADSTEKPAKRTKKVGIVGKYGTRYGASLRKMVKKIEISQHAKYTCSFCGKTHGIDTVLSSIFQTRFLLLCIFTQSPTMVSGVMFLQLQHSSSSEMNITWTKVPQVTIPPPRSPPWCRHSQVAGTDLKFQKPGFRSWPQHHQRSSMAPE